MNERIEHLEQQASRLWNQRLVVLGATTAIVSAIIVWIVGASEHWISFAAMVPVLLILISACYVTKHLTDSAVRIMAYLEVFHESPGSHPVRRFHAELGQPRPDAEIGVMYVLLAITAGWTFLACCEDPNSIEAAGLLRVFILLPLLGYFIVKVATLFEKPAFETYCRSWRKVRSEATEPETEFADSDQMDE